MRLMSILVKSKTLRRSVGIPALLSVVILSIAHVARAYTEVPIPRPKPQLINYTTKPVYKPSLNDFMKPQNGQNDQDLGVLVPIPTDKPVLKNAERQNFGDAELYRKIFDLQAAGDIKQADTLISKLGDKVLMGHVLSQRYMHPTAYTSSFNELKSWLDKYSDHPEADRIYELAKRKQPDSFKGTLEKPQNTVQAVRMTEPTMQAARNYKTSKNRSAAEDEQVASLKSDIRKTLKAGKPEEALGMLKASPALKFMDTAEQDIEKADIAASYYYQGETRKAFELASKAAKSSMMNVPQAGWIGGLSAWRLGQHKVAAAYFEVAAASPYVSGWMASAGAYWAARSHMRAGNIREVSAWYNKARDYPRTFYGLAATRALGLSHNFDWKVAKFKDSDAKWLMSDPHGRRAIALVAAKQYFRAAEELKSVETKNESQRTALIAYANFAGLPSLALRLGGYFSSMDNASYDAALYPQGNWLRQDEYRIEPELIHAIIRQESKFNPTAESVSGATGLMQLLPTTASFITGDPTLKTEQGMHKLEDPKTNLKIGQAYLQNLLGDKSVNGNLLNLLIAYNAGPGNLAKWKTQLSDIDDSMLFIESIPSAQAREYVERVIANYWIYKMRFGNDMQSLDAVAAGKTPFYPGYDKKPFKLVSKN